MSRVYGHRHRSEIWRNNTVRTKFLEPTQSMDLVGIQKWEYLAIGLNRSPVLLGIDCMPRLSTVFCGVKPRIPPRALAVTVGKRNSRLLEMSEFQVCDVENGLNSFPRLPWSMSSLEHVLCTIPIRRLHGKVAGRRLGTPNLDRRWGG